MVDTIVHPNYQETDDLNLYISNFTNKMSRMFCFCLGSSRNRTFSLEFAVNEVWRER